MPKWCMNTLVVRGEPQQLEALLEQWAEDDRKFHDNQEVTSFTFHSFVPEPHQTEESEDWDGHYWRLENWGTKWDASSVDIDTENLDAGEVRIHFDTAWSPPTPVILALQEQIKPKGMRAKMWSFEPGVGFQVYHDENGYVESLKYRNPDWFLEEDLEPIEES